MGSRIIDPVSNTDRLENIVSKELKKYETKAECEEQMTPIELQNVETLSRIIFKIPPTAPVDEDGAPLGQVSNEELMKALRRP